MVGLCLLQKSAHPAREVAALVADQGAVVMKTAHNAPERAESLSVDEVGIWLGTLAHGASSDRAIVAFDLTGPRLKNSETGRRRVQ
jgi:hypothetical protein